MFSVAGWPVWGLIALFIVGLALIVKGGDFFVDAAGWIAEVSGIPRFIVGATIVSFATISVSAVAIAPFKAEILPPPGTGALPAVSARNPLIVKSTSIMSIF